MKKLKSFIYQSHVKGSSKNVAGVRTKVVPVAVVALRSMPVRLSDNLWGWHFPNLISELMHTRCVIWFVSFRRQPNQRLNY